MPRTPKQIKKPNGRDVSVVDVAKRAYEIYQSRGGRHGSDFDDWLEAERQLKPTAKSRKRAPSAGT